MTEYVPWMPAEMVQSEGQRLYPHVARPRYGEISEDSDPWNDPYDWCAGRYGPQALMDRPDLPDRAYPKLFKFDLNFVWVRLSGTYYFRHADHAFEFKMRWG